MTWIQNIDALMNAVQQLKIPINKYRWLSKVKENTLIIKGKTTVLCVLEPLMTKHNKFDYLPIDLEGEHYVSL